MSIDDIDIDIKITDSVAPTISPKLNAIADSATRADTATAKLQYQLNRNKLVSQRTATEFARTAVMTQRLETASLGTARAASRLAIEQARVSAATDRASISAVRAAITQQRLEQATLRTAAAQRRAQEGSRGGGGGGLPFRGIASSVAGAAATALPAIGVLRLADSYTTLQNKLAIVTESQAQVNTLTDELFSIANRTRSSVEATATAFARFDRASRILGKSQEDTLRLTETVNKALIVGGATASEQSSSLLQLSQAFNAGRLNGDEFRSVSENMPIVLDAVALALGKPVNQLKTLASQGKITSEVLFKAFKLIEDRVDKAFSKTEITLGQGFEIARNNAIKFFGELNKTIGLTSGLARAFVFLSENLDVVAFTATAVGAAMLIAFGPAIVGAIGTATAAVWAFTAALIANPIGLLAVGIAAIVAGLILLGDRVKTTEDGFVTLKDQGLAVFGFIGDGASALGSWVSKVWDSAIDEVNLTTKGWGTEYTSLGQLIVGQSKKFGNYVIAVLDAMGSNWSRLGTIGLGVLKSWGNFAIEVGEQLLNAILFPAQAMLRLARVVAPDTAEEIGRAFGNFEIKLPKFDTSEADKALASLKGDIKELAKTDYIGNFVDDVSWAINTRATAIAEERRKTAEAEKAALRAEGENTAGSAGASKRAMSRALWLAKVNLELDNELNRLLRLKPEREALARIDELSEKAFGRRIKLTDEETNSLVNKIQTVQRLKEVQTEYDRVYESSIAPAREFEATSHAINLLLLQGHISLRRYNAEFQAATEKYEQAVDPLKAINRELAERNRLLNLPAEDRQFEAEVAEIAKRNSLNRAETEGLRQSLKVQNEHAQAIAVRDALLANSVKKRQDFVDQLAQINNLLQSSTGFTKSDALLSFEGTEVGNVLGVSDSMINAELVRMQTMFSQLDAMRQLDIINEQEAADAKAELWRQHNRNVAQRSAERLESELHTTKTFFTNLAGFQKVKQRELFAVGKAAAIANATVSTYQAATSAYAAMAGIPVVGPALGVAAAAGAIAAGLANVQEIAAQSPGFSLGGYTGDVARSQVAGVVHGQEYVLNAQTTARIGTQSLDKLQSGVASVRDNNDRSVERVQTNSTAQQTSAPTELKLRLVNALDQSLAPSLIGSSEGEIAVLNLIKRNGEEIKELLGL